MKTKEYNFGKKGVESLLKEDSSVRVPEEKEKNKMKQDTKVDYKKNTKISNKNFSLNFPKNNSNYNKPLIFTTVFTILLVSVISYLLFYYVITPLNNINDSVNKIQDETLALLVDFNDKDLRNIDERSNNIKLELDNIQKEIDRYKFLQNYGATKGYYDNLLVGRNILDKTQNLIDETLPEFKNILSSSGFKVDDSVQVEVLESGEEVSEASALSLVLKEFPSYIELYENIEPEIYDIFAEVKKIDPEYIPNLGDYGLKDKIIKANDLIDEFPETSEKTKNFVSSLPSLVGANSPARYMIILQNETEMRASGGLLTAYGHTTVENGEFGEDIFLADMWNLELYVRYTLGINAGPKNFSYYKDYPDYVNKWGGFYQNIYGQDYLMNSGCGATGLRAQDSGIYPDLHFTMNILKDYYDLASRFDKEEYPDYDHIVILNHHFSERLLSLIQPLYVEGYGDVTADNLFDFIKEETDDSTKQFDPNRKDIIGDIANAAKDKFLNLPLTDIPKVVDILIEAIQAKDLGIASIDPTVQEYLDEYGLSGRIAQDFEGDYFHLNEAQNCSLKLNKFVRDKVTQDIYIGEAGDYYKQVKVVWSQPQIYEPSLNKYYDTTTKFSYRAWVRIFAPKDSGQFNSDGYWQSGYLYYTPKEYYDDVMNKDISDNIIQFDHRRFVESDPIEKRTLNVGYSLPAHLNYNTTGEYKMLIQKHPGKSWGEEYEINIHFNGEIYSVKFILDRDKVVTFRGGVISVDNYDTSLDWVKSLVRKIPFDKINESTDSVE